MREEMSKEPKGGWGGSKGLVFATSVTEKLDPDYLGLEPLPYLQERDRTKLGQLTFPGPVSRSLADGELRLPLPVQAMIGTGQGPAQPGMGDHRARDDGFQERQRRLPLQRCRAGRQLARHAPGGARPGRVRPAGGNRLPRAGAAGRDRRHAGDRRAAGARPRSGRLRVIGASGLANAQLWTTTLWHRDRSIPIRKLPTAHART